MYLKNQIKVVKSVKSRIFTRIIPSKQVDKVINQSECWRFSHAKVYFYTFSLLAYWRNIWSFPGNDGICRVVRIKMLKSEITRSVNQIHPLILPSWFFLKSCALFLILYSSSQITYFSFFNHSFQYSLSYKTIFCIHHSLSFLKP